MTEIETQRCRDLWAAVMWQGLVDASDEMRKRITSGPAMRWFISNENFPGSWVWLCELFDMEPDQARSLARMKFRMLSRLADYEEEK